MKRLAILIVDDAADDAAATAKIERLREHFAVRSEQLVPVSYRDLAGRSSSV